MRIKQSTIEADKTHEGIRSCIHWSMKWRIIKIYNLIAMSLIYVLINSFIFKREENKSNALEFMFYNVGQGELHPLFHWPFFGHFLEKKRQKKKDNE